MADLSIVQCLNIDIVHSVQCASFTKHIFRMFSKHPVKRGGVVVSTLDYGS